MEEYRDIKDYEKYQVSNTGNVRNKITRRVLIPGVNNSTGYYAVYLYKERKGITKQVHRLVCQAFLENPENKTCVDHCDGNKLNNNLKNLRWATKKENCQNQKLSKKNTSGIKGVYFNKPLNKWMAYICIDGNLINLGYYNNIEDAQAVRVAAANKSFGVFTHTCELLKA